MQIILFIICLCASSVGTIVGAGGGVIIKPLLDLLGLLPVSTVSFCSGCTVLGMSLCSLIRTRKSDVKLEFRTSTPLAIGAVLGGLVGKFLFELVRNGFGSESTLGAIQAVLLLTTEFGVFLYVCNKDKLPSKHVTGNLPPIIIGMCLGILSSFLGIGGGTSNVAVLFFFFSMDAKTAAKNSIYVIVFSQIASIITAIVTNSVPAFEMVDLLFMVAGGIGGALLGSAISKRINNKGVEKVMKIVLLLMTAINLYNVLQFTVL